MQRRRPTTAATLLLLVTTGCTGGDDATPTTTVAATTTVPPTTAPSRLDVDELATILASRDPATLNGAASVAVPDSPAARYLSHQSAARSILPDSEPAAVRSSAGAVSLCSGAGDCVAITGIELDPATGLLRDFGLDDQSISERITGAGIEALVDEVGVTVRSASVSTDGALTVVIETRNSSGADIEWFGFAATYAASDGVVVEATGAWGPALVAANTVESMLVAFPATELEGTLTLFGLREDDIDVRVDVDVPGPGG